MKLKKGIIIICMLFLTIVITGCSGWYSPKTGYLTRFIERTVPYTISIPPGHVNIIEEDSYGRILFDYDDHGISVVAVCQNTDCDSICYYYEDIHAVTVESLNDITEEQIERLKKVNDWEAPLQTEKMTYYNEFECQYPNYELATEILQTEYDYADDVFPGDRGFRNNEKHILFAEIDDPLTEERKNIILFISEEQSGIVYEIVELKSRYQYHAELKKLKEKYGWETESVDYNDLF